MQITENWSRISGRVESWSPPSRPDQPGILTVRLDTVEPVRAKGRAVPSFLEGAPGRSVKVQVSAAAASTMALETGTEVELDVRRGRTPDRLFAHPERLRVKPRGRRR
jgi:hypothetical protein